MEQVWLSTVLCPGRESMFTRVQWVSLWRGRATFPQAGGSMPLHVPTCYQAGSMAGPGGSDTQYNVAGWLDARSKLEQGWGRGRGSAAS